MVKKLLTFRTIALVTSLLTALITLLIAFLLVDSMQVTIALGIVSIVFSIIGVSSFIFSTSKLIAVEATKNKANYSLSNELINNSDTGLLLYDNFNRIIEVSSYLKSNGLIKIEGQLLSDIFPDLKKESANNIKNGTKYEIEGKVYQVKNVKSVNALILRDITPIRDLHIKSINDRNVVILVKLVNLHSEQTSQIQKTRFFYETMQILTKWSNKYKAFFYSDSSSIEELKWNININYSGFRKAFFDSEEDRKKNNLFTYLDDFYKKSNFSVLISMGIGYGGLNAEENGILALNALKEAENSGSNQIVINENHKETYKLTENLDEEYVESKHSINIFATRIFEKLENSNSVILIGHNFADADSLASLISMHEIAIYFNCNVKIYLDTLDTSAQKILDQLASKKIRKNIISSEKELNSLISKETLIVIQDVTSKSRIPNLEKIKTHSPENLVLIDHHLPSEDSIFTKSMNSLSNSNSSSVSEMMTIFFEILETRNKDFNLDKNIATMLLVGIYIDSLGLTSSVSYHTFNALSFLTRKNISIGEAVKYSNIELKTFTDSNAILENIQVINSKIVVATANDSFIVKNNLSLAIAVDRLVKIENIQAAFIIARISSDTVKISVRETGEYNSAEVCKFLGGGGRESAGAVIIKNKTIDETKEILLNAIRKVGKN